MNEIWTCPLIPFVAILFECGSVHLDGFLLVVAFTCLAFASSFVLPNNCSAIHLTLSSIFIPDSLSQSAFSFNECQACPQLLSLILPKIKSAGFGVALKCITLTCSGRSRICDLTATPIIPKSCDGSRRQSPRGRQTKQHRHSCPCVQVTNTHSGHQLAAAAIPLTWIPFRHNSPRHGHDLPFRLQMRAFRCPAILLFIIPHSHQSLSPPLAQEPTRHQGSCKSTHPHAPFQRSKLSSSALG